MVNRETITSSLVKWTESIIIIMGFMVISMFLHDPLSLDSPFPWIWYAPALIGLRYGIWPALFCIVALFFSYLKHDLTPLENIHFQLFTLGGFVLTLICTVSHSRWNQEVKKNEEVAGYLQQRIQSIAQAYKVTSLAYQRIEQNYIMKPVTVRTSLVELREQLARSKKRDDKALYSRFLNILTQQCGIEVAGIFPVKRGVLNPKPITSVGRMSSSDPNDFLVQTSIERKTITYIRAKDISKGYSGHVLIAAPFVDANQNIYAFLLVQGIPFLQLNHENVETINLLLQYFLGGHTVLDAKTIVNAFPDCPVEFANELQRLIHLYKKTKRDSMLVALTFLKTRHQDDYLFRLKQEKRGIDCTWEASINHVKVLFVLMPMLDHTGVEGYKARINTMLKEEFKTALNKDKVKYMSVQVSSIREPVSFLQQFLNDA